MLQSVLSHAVVEGYRDDNPARAVRKPRVDRGERRGQRVLAAARSSIRAVEHLPNVAKAALRIDEALDELLPILVPH